MTAIVLTDAEQTERARKAMREARAALNSARVMHDNHTRKARYAWCLYCVVGKRYGNAVANAITSALEPFAYALAPGNDAECE
jgi:hypothetical protein